MRVQFIHGSSLDVLKTFRDNTFQTVVTSPPYWQQRDYQVSSQIGQEATVEEYVADMVKIMEEVKRTLRKDGTVWFNIGDTYVRSDINTSLKNKNKIGVPWKLAFAFQENGWILRQDVIWCLSGGTEVYVRTNGHDFPTNVKDLYRLNPESVQLWNGEKWTKMLGMSKNKQQHNEIQITLRSGERICCTPNHRWPTTNGLSETKDLKIGDTLIGCSLPEPSNIFVSDYLPDSEVGWFVGMYIAEGSRSGNTIQIASHKKEIKRYERLKFIVEKYHGTCHKHDTSENGMTINLESDILNAVINMYIGGKVAKNKHLKYRCWRRNNIFLRGILDGYLEGDGHYDKINDRYRIGFTRNYYLEKSLRTLCSRLGVSCRIKLSHSKIGDKIYKTFRGEIRFNKKNHFNSKSDYEIVEISRDKGGREYFYDIEVQDEPHLFSLSSGILTHNSKTNPMPDGAKDRPTTSHEYMFLFAKSEDYYYDYFASLEDSEKAVKGKQKFGSREQIGTNRHDQQRTFEHYGKRNKRSVWSTPVSRFEGSHWATFNTELIEPAILASTSEKGCCPKCKTCWNRIIDKSREENGQLELTGNLWEPGCSCGIQETEPCLVLDPFSGASTTGFVCAKHHRDYVAIDVNEEYLEVAKKRLGSNDSQDIFLADYIEEYKFNSDEYFKECKYEYNQQ